MMADITSVVVGEFAGPGLGNSEKFGANRGQTKQMSDTGFSQILKGKDKEFLDTFKLCKENLQNGSKTAGVINGKLTHDGNWISDASRTKIPLNVLTSVGFFDIPPSRYEKLTLTAQHLSFVEFFASVGIILSSDIEAELDKIGNRERTIAVSIYIWNDLLKFKKSTNLSCRKNILW